MEVTNLSVFIGFILGVAGIMFFLGILLGKEIEKEKWHKMLLNGIDKKKSLKWTSRVNIMYTSEKKGVEPKISLAVGSVKPSTNNSDGS